MYLKIQSKCLGNKHFQFDSKRTGALMDHKMKRLRKHKKNNQRSARVSHITGK
jgi:hypothetical protein